MVGNWIFPLHPVNFIVHLGSRLVSQVELCSLSMSTFMNLMLTLYLSMLHLVTNFFFMYLGCLYLRTVCFKNFLMFFIYALTIL